MKIYFYRTSSGRDPVGDFIESLPKSDKARFADVLVGIKAFGLDYDRVTFKPLEGKLWEIKFNAKGGGYRIAYVLVDRESMYWLHAFKKESQKTRLGDLELAKKRMKGILSC